MASGKGTVTPISLVPGVSTLRPVYRFLLPGTLPSLEVSFQMQWTGYTTSRITHNPRSCCLLFLRTGTQWQAWAGLPLKGCQETSGCFCWYSETPLELFTLWHLFLGQLLLFMTHIVSFFFFFLMPNIAGTRLIHRRGKQMSMRCVQNRLPKTWFTEFKKTELKGRWKAGLWGL